MYRFQIRAFTQPGEAIALVGSVPQLGQWDVAHCVRLQTRPDRYPLWWVDLDLPSGAHPVTAPYPPTVEYKYIRVRDEGGVEWEAWGKNRWIPLEPEPHPSLIIVDEGDLGFPPTYPYGYWAEPVVQPPSPLGENGLKIVVMGSSVALGCSAWMLRGWAWHLGQALQPQGHQLVNVSELGANVGTAIAHFAQRVAPERPDIVVIALSLGNEGLAWIAPHHYRSIQRRFEQGLQQLIQMTRDLGARPILGGVYPHSGYSTDHYQILQETHQRMLTWDVPVLDWLATLEDGQGRWQASLAFDAAHPNSLGHQRMYEAIDFTHFQPSSAPAPLAPALLPYERPIYQDGWGFHSFACTAEPGLRLSNTTPHPYRLNPDWQAWQTALQADPLGAGLYLAEDPESGALKSLVVQDDGTIPTELDLPPATDLKFYPPLHFFAPSRSQVIFYDGQLALLKVKESSGTRSSDRTGIPISAPRLYVINESDHEYNIQPMWQQVRDALKALPSGVYEDLSHPDLPFRTLMIGKDGLESRVKAPPQSAMVLDYQCQLSERNRVAILPLGDRCAVRMLLYKLEYDGPAFPFDLTRTTQLADVADMIQSDFQAMWNPSLLHYNPDERRIYHAKWTGLSFAHEVEEDEDPVQDMSPIYERMRVRYTARSQRFRYTLQACDKVLFIRTGICDRGAVMDLVQKLEQKCQGKPFGLLLISPQASDEFADLPHVQHHNLEFNPDRMYSNLEYWLYCTEVMRGILHDLGISSQNLFWCPPTPPTEAFSSFMSQR